MNTPRSLKWSLALGSVALAIFLGATDIAGAQTLNTAPLNPSSIPGADDILGNSPVNPWDDGIVDTLYEQKMIAVQNFADGNTLMAVAQYKKGLVMILETAGRIENRLSWTYKISERTLNLVDRLLATGGRNDEKRLMAVISILQSSYDLIENYYDTLDVPFYTPYCLFRDGKTQAPRYDIAQFQNILSRYVEKQIQWFQHAFVMNTDELGTVPKYSSKVFLITLASMTHGLAQDLASDPRNPDPNLFPLIYAPIARSLERLSRDIDDHLAGNGIFGNDQRAVNFSYTRFTQIIAHLQSLGK